MTLQSINPATGELIQEFPELTTEQIEEKLHQAHREFAVWSQVLMKDRKKYMLRLADILKTRKKELGTLLTQEMGKPITQAVSEVEKCAWVCEYYASETENVLQDELINTDALESFVRFDPLGVIFAIMPWNFAFWQVMRFAVPAVMAGNIGVLKHASNVPQSAEMIEHLFLEAEFPAGVFQNFLISSSQVEGIIRDSRVAAVTFTGSEFAGSKVAEEAGSEIKPTVLELGGSDAFIVLDDADVERACDVAVMARLQNNGQSCIAAKRFIVLRKVSQEFLRLLKRRYEVLKIGDPMQEETQIGPLATESIRNDLARQVNESVTKGAKVIIGGNRIEGKGFFYTPTILIDIQPGMPAYDEEIFGPVAPVIVVEDAEQAIQVANDTKFGLGASLWTRNIELAKAIAKRLQVGSVFINGIVKSDPRLPFGGIKKSGYGRELSHYGMKAFMNIKTVWIQ